MPFKLKTTDIHPNYALINSLTYVFIEKLTTQDVSNYICMWMHTLSGTRACKGTLD